MVILDIIRECGSTLYVGSPFFIYYSKWFFCYYNINKWGFGDSRLRVIVRLHILDYNHRAVIHSQICSHLNT